MAAETIRKTCELRGVVQGVGFRPTLHRLAGKAGLSGWVQNCAGKVRLIVEGPRTEVDLFLADLPSCLPAQARLDALDVIDARVVPDSERLHGFTIRASADDDDATVVIPADLALCAACRDEVLDPDQRRYGYPFATCTDCGPRYTVVTGLPYDRERTTLAAFPLCPDCRREYEDPADRRFHAETIACPVCGPRVRIAAEGGTLEGRDALREARLALGRGEIVAVRGIGGYLLAADAFSRAALERLRRRKHRPHKPLAVMARDLSTLQRYAFVPEPAQRLLTSPQAPIVILDTRGAAPSALPLDLITPDTDTLGAMLPTSPLHDLLFHRVGDDPTPPFELLVMTSGNRRGEPICLTNDEALHRLDGIADRRLEHNREINLRNDDSVCVVQLERPQVWRRARGFSPAPVMLARPLARPVLAMGAELKNTVAVGFRDQVVLSAHVGDLETPEALDGLETVVDCLPRFLGCVPGAVAVDLHPDMHATRLGRRLARELGVPVVPVQHHHAHALACLAEHGLEAGLALVFDGAGLGPDGTVWGAELLEVDPSGYRALAAFADAPVPGGDAAVLRPARQLVGRWAQCELSLTDTWRRELGVTPRDAALWAHQCRRGLNTPVSRSAGRVFDAFAAALGVAPDRITYEGQAAIRLEAVALRHAERSGVQPVPYRAAEQDAMLRVDWRDAFCRLFEAGRPADTGYWAVALHLAVARAAAEMVDYAVSNSPLRTVVLSGGVFMNRLLNELLVPALRDMGLLVLVHETVPPNDGCIALGQAVAAGGR